MEDTRILEKLANDLVESGGTLTFRFLMSDNRIIERVLQPVVKSKTSEETLYRDIRTVYAPKKGYHFLSLESIDFSKMIKIGRSDESASTTKNGIIKNRIEYILRSGYQLIKTEVK